jgi:hypothetical protein
MKLADSPKYTVSVHRRGWFSWTVNAHQRESISTQYVQQGSNLSWIMDEGSDARILFRRGMHFLSVHENHVLIARELVL